MKRLLSFLLCAFLVASLVPLYAFASDEINFIISIPDVDLPDNDELFAGYAEKTFYPENQISPFYRIARDGLNDQAKGFYDFLKSKVISVANGEVELTVFTAEYSDFTKWGVDASINSNDVNTEFGKFLESIQYAQVINALISDCPYEFYWFDKTIGYSIGGSYGYVGGKFCFTELTVKFYVSEDYQGDNYSTDSPNVSLALTGATSVAVANAKAIVEKYSDLSDYEMILAYRDEVLSLVEYNWAVADDKNAAYGDPWQIIYVFDNDTTTNVVCEGYSKAFQYLCDMTDFHYPDIHCNSVVGKTNGGGHMWNILTMHGGKHYIADLTNSDTNTYGSDGGLFLNGMEGSVRLGYRTNVTIDFEYIYDSNELMVWGTDADSILILSDTDFDPEALHIEFDDENDVVYDGMSVSHEDLNYTVYGDGDYDEFEFFYEWYSDNNGVMGDELGYAPADVGEYWLKVTAVNTIDTHDVFSGWGRFSISPKLLNISSVSVNGKTYDGSANADITSVIFSLYMGDDVRVEYTSAAFSSADAGQKDEVTLYGVTLSGSDAHNYTLESSTFTVMIDPPVVIDKGLGSDIPPAISGNYAVSENDNEKFAYTVSPMDGCEYRMDDGVWQDSNVFDLIPPETDHKFYIRQKETANVLAGVAAEISVKFDKLENPKTPEKINVQFQQNSDNATFTLTITPVENGVYSFDGIDFTENNVKTDCLPQTEYTVSVKLAETSVYSESEVIVSTFIAPQIHIHAPSTDWKYDENAHWHECGCGEVMEILSHTKGKEADCENAQLCTICRCVLMDALGHGYEWVITKDVEIGVDGVKEYKCVLCGDVDKTETIPALSDGNSDWMLGDVNKNGKIDMTDYIILKRAYFGTYSLDADQNKRGDINKNDKIDMTDYILLKRVYFGTYKLPF